MRNTLKQAVVLWGMVLLLVLWSVFISPSGVLRWAGAAAIVLAVAALLIYRRRQAWTEMTGDAGLSSLPPETYRQPVVLVCGDMSAHLFADSPVRQVSEGLYLHVSDEEQLVAQVERLLTLRPAWASQLAVAYTVMPGIHRDVAVLAGQLRRFAHSMATVRRRAGVNVPWLLWSGLSGSPLPERAYSPWLICTGGEIQVATSAETASPAQWLTQTSTQELSQPLCYLLKAESLMQWLNLNVLAALNGPEAKCPPLAMAVGLPPSLPEVDNNLWQSWITARTGLTPDIADTGTDATLPFPDALLRRLPRQSGFTPLRRACVTMLGITTAAGIAALCLSATANRQLLRHIGDDLHQFYAVPAEEFITKARRLSVLKDDAVMLDGYYREGEPLRLGLGLYPGEQIRQPVLRAIRDWRPPEQKMEVTASLQAQTVRLDSMSLFDVGQARLKDGSTKVLVDALVNIRAKPGWLILVAGYTDATGDEKSNQQLSLRRAEAVRNWMLQTSDIPATCFAVQGLGESQPAATNDTPQGRAVNRRVEISLVPRSDACQDVK
ncbi:OmpA family protein [Escherichia coli]|nr:OmpA family protein [Escherichia coli]